MQTAHKIELNPNNKQKTYFKKACGVARFAFNWGLAEWNRLYELNRKLPLEERIKISGMSLKKSFNAIKHEKFPWALEVTKYAAQQPFIDLQNGFNRFFNKKGKKPKFKKKGKSEDSFYVGGDQIKVKGKNIHVPNLGLVRIKECPRYTGKINSATFSRVADKWFVSIQYELPDMIDVRVKRDAIVGIDLGINYMAVTSDGHAIESPRPLSKIIRQLKREQRVLSKKNRVAKKEGRELSHSKNYQKQKLKVAKLHYRVFCKRDDALHKVTSFLANNYRSIAIEDLNVKGMVKNHNLARAIQDVGFGKFRRLLAYKTERNGGELYVVDRFFPSSKRCSKCHKIKDVLLLSERVYTCECGYIGNRDLNAAENLKQQIGRVPAELTPVEITAMQEKVYPIFVTSIGESGSKHQILSR